MEYSESGDSAEIYENQQDHGSQDACRSDEYALVKRWKISLIVLSLLSFFFFPLAGWLQVSPISFLPGPCYDPIFFYMIVFGVTLVFLPVLMFGVFFKRFRQMCMYWSAIAVIQFVFPVAGCAVSMDWQNNLRMSGMQAFTERMQPVLDAIDEYVLKNGRPPESLEKLIPEYIAEIPSTGLGAYTDLNYQLHQGDMAEEYGGNDWSLYLNTPLGIMNWDMMIYLPNQNYPEY